MRLTETLQKIKHYPDLAKDTFVFLLLILVAFGAFFIGRSSVESAKRVGELRIRDTTGQVAANTYFAATKDVAPESPIFTSQDQKAPGGGKAQNNPGMYVGSKSGKTYYLPWCGGVKRIKDENKIWFSSRGDAEAKGYKAAANCRGL